METTITIDPEQHAHAEHIAAKRGLTVAEYYAAVVAAQRLNMADQVAADEVERKLKLADAIDKAKDDDTKVKIVAAAEAVVADAKEEL